MTADATRHPRLGLVVNPLAGVGGAVGLKGSDGDAVVRLALERGAVPHAPDRAVAALSALATSWLRHVAPGTSLPEVLAAPRAMGAEEAAAAGFVPVVVGSLPGDRATTAEDTRRIVGELATAGVDLLLVVGGDGTARDVCASAPEELPVLGIPAGVKIHSPVYATSPRAGGELAAAFLAAPAGRRRTAQRDVLDLDEDAYRRGEVAPRLHGELRVPVEDRRLQARKEPSPASEAAAAASIAAGIAASLVPGRRYVLGPGSTLRAVGATLGVPKTLVGVDVVEAGEAPLAPERAPAPLAVRVIAPDVGEAELLRLVDGHDAAIVVTPIGGQGFILGRGNQQLGPAVLRAVLGRLGREALVVVATPAKLASLRGRPLLVDSGDAALDAELAGHLRVVTGRDETTIYPVIPA